MHIIILHVDFESDVAVAGIRECVRDDTTLTLQNRISSQGRIQGGGGAPGAPPPPKIGKNAIFWRKIVIFHTKYPKNFRATLCIWKKI